jgi:hypothetical protein
MSSHEKMAGSFLYATPVTVLTLVRTVCKKKERHKTTTDHEQLDFQINNLSKKKKKKLYDPKLAIKSNLYHVKKLYISQCIALLKRRKVDR